MVSNSEQILWKNTQSIKHAIHTINVLFSNFTRSDSLSILLAVAGDHFPQEYFWIGFGFVGQALFQLFTVQMDHGEIGFCREADNLFWKSTELLHSL